MKELIGFTDMTASHRLYLRQIHALARVMEKEGQDGKAHYRIALLEELSKEPTSLSYIQEKIEGLFS